MSHILKHSRLLLVAVCCVAVGAGASVIAGAGAATSTKTNATGHRSHNGRKGGLRRVALHAVHGDVVMHTKAGFRTVTFDRGVVDSVAGQRLKITEGTPKATYKTVTLAIPANAVVRDDKQKSSLSSVNAGQRVLVVTAPNRTLVIARTARTPPATH
ncbi:MAG TPA: hypothetical protein VHW04_08635 [Solirubrobacteraceae bacterium]|nr:hypothetical protein [Solirubrobacteraceae bacterium]